MVSICVLLYYVVLYWLFTYVAFQILLSFMFGVVDCFNPLWHSDENNSHVSCLWCVEVDGMTLLIGI